MNPAGKDAVLNLLAVEFSETEAPSGVVTLTFSGGAAVRLEVECLEAELADLGPSWTTAACPVHAVGRGRAAEIRPPVKRPVRPKLHRNNKFGSELRA